MTITEALAEIKTIEKRLASKREFVLTYLCQHESLKDPLASDGGSEQLIRRERQSIDDLEQRIVDIRAAVARINEKTTITIGGKTRTMTEWLAWRKDVSQSAGQFLNQMRQRINQFRQAANQGNRMIGSSDPRVMAALHVQQNQGDSKPSNVNVFVNEQELSKESEAFGEILGQLDGQLSLKNATTEIELKPLAERK